MLVPDRLDTAHAIEAGRAWQRLHLAATTQELCRTWKDEISGKGLDDDLGAREAGRVECGPSCA